MNEGTLRELLLAFRRGEVTLDEVLARLRHLPYEDLGFAKLDHHRLLRQGFPEVVFGQGKTPEQIAAIVVRLLERGSVVLVTRTDEAAYTAVHRVVPEAVYHPHARMITIRRDPPPEPEGLIAVVSAGTADIPVAEEAAITAEALGSRVARFWPI